MIWSYQLYRSTKITKAKQTVEPFNQTTNRVTQSGELTHIDMWGKYHIASIQGNQYYIVYVDDRG
jgi:hypothetical protein